MKLVKEHIDFKRGVEPKSAMSTIDENEIKFEKLQNTLKPFGEAAEELKKEWSAILEIHYHTDRTSFDYDDMYIEIKYKTPKSRSKKKLKGLAAQGFAYFSVGFDFNCSFKIPKYSIYTKKDAKQIISSEIEIKRRPNKEEDTGGETSMS